ncbi:3D domain-containing protein [Sporosarcina aquimarina]|uniref:3D domain-containing protein n=1 Tax=Sporosarcina aquimarina TaxID=114975 RepID=A0ABU4G1P4_9BACL|nr:3D domain-containing protein [Sporosarcina aquimarina]MDW0110868.1 3D domain-containing protein [Sporosarcina aquimarina]
MRKIVQAMIFLLAIFMLASPVVAESNDSLTTDKTELKEGRDAYPFQPAIATELVVDNPLLEEQQPALTYTVQAGDNLFRIAKAHSISVQSLMGWNGLTSDLIRPGDQLNVSIEAPGSTTNLMKTKTLAAKPAATKPPQTNTNTSKTAQPAVQPPSETKTASAQATTPVSSQTGREMTMRATAYTAYCTGCSGTTKIGINLRANPNLKVIAVDPSVIPLGSRVWVEGYGEAIAGDTGGAIKGNKIDVFIPGQDSAMAWGVKTVKVKVLNK